MSDFVHVELLGPLLTIDRIERFEKPLNAALTSTGIGKVLGGKDVVRETVHFLDGSKTEWAGVFVELSDLKSGLPELARITKDLGGDKYTTLFWSENGRECGGGLGDFMLLPGTPPSSDLASVYDQPGLASVRRRFLASFKG